eukprot:807629-Prorocentrum_minimum.AAC.1
MGGVGSFNRLVRTLYVGCGGERDGAMDAAVTATMKRLLTDTFAEFGPLEHVHVVSAKSVAFVRYAHRAYAEFAK